MKRNMTRCFHGLRTNGPCLLASRNLPAEHDLLVGLRLSPKRSLQAEHGLLQGRGLLVGYSLLTGFCLLIGTVGTAQTVQLPTYSHFGTSTTVRVPDRGSMSMGGITSSSSSGSSSGAPGLPFRNRSTSSSGGASNVSTSVYVHDFEAMEEELLGSSGNSAASSSRSTNPASREYAGSIGGGSSARLEAGAAKDHTADRSGKSTPNRSGKNEAKRTAKRTAKTRTQADAQTAGANPVQPNIAAWQRHARGANPTLNSDLVVAAAGPDSDSTTFGSVPDGHAVRDDSAGSKRADSVTSANSVKRAATGADSTESPEKRVNSLLKKGKAEEKAGRNASAMLYYEEAAVLATGELAKKVQQRIDQLNGKD